MSLHLLRLQLSLVKACVQRGTVCNLAMCLAGQGYNIYSIIIFVQNYNIYHRCEATSDLVLRHFGPGSFVGATEAYTNGNIR